MKKEEVIEYQTVKRDVYEEYSCMLLRDNELSKQEALLAGLMRLSDKDGELKIGVIQRDELCGVFGMSMAEFNNALSRYRKIGILISSGEFLQFKNELGIKSDKLYLFVR